MPIAIWYKDPKDFLLNPDTLIEIIPNKTMTLAQQLNAVMRFGLYFTVIVLLIKRDYTVTFFMLFIAVVTMVIYENNSTVNKEKLELFDKMNNNTLLTYQKITKYDCSILRSNKTKNFVKLANSFFQK
jgi:hypothetical protein